MRWITLSFCIALALAGRRVRYYASVFQVASVGKENASAADNLRSNLKYWDDEITRFSQQGSVPDVVVFPEWVLYLDLVFGPLSRRESAWDYSEVFPPAGVHVVTDARSGPQAVALARIAMKHEVLLAANVLARIPCTSASLESSFQEENSSSRWWTSATPLVDVECPADGAFLLNSEFVVAPNGTVVALYHKINLFDESPPLDLAPLPLQRVTVVDVALPRAKWVDSDAAGPRMVRRVTADDSNISAGASTFSSSMSLVSSTEASGAVPVVRFGVCVCYDLDFAHPSAEFVHHGAVDVLVSSLWGNIYPLEAAHGVQQAYSAALSSNLIIGNAAQEQGSGSGVYAAGEVVVQTRAVGSQAVGGWVTTAPAGETRPRAAYEGDIHSVGPQVSASGRSPSSLLSSSSSSSSHLSSRAATSLSDKFAPPKGVPSDVTLCHFMYSIMPCKKVVIPPSPFTPTHLPSSAEAPALSVATVTAESQFYPAGRNVSCHFEGHAALHGLTVAPPLEAAVYVVLFSAPWVFNSNTHDLTHETCQIVPCVVNASYTPPPLPPLPNPQVVCSSAISLPGVKMSAGSKVTLSGASSNGKSRYLTMDPSWAALSNRTASLRFASGLERRVGVEGGVTFTRRVEIEVVEDVIVSTLAADNTFLKPLVSHGP